MPGSTQPWDQSEDPRESTVDLPRIDLAGLADYFRGAAPPPRPAVAAQLPSGEPAPDAPSAEAELDGDEPPAPSVHTAEAAAAIRDPAAAGALQARQPAEPVQAIGPQIIAPAARPSAGSLGDLRSRLARLPAGHPSSPYEDGGHARPSPTRLRQLELGLPAPGREPGDGAASGADAGDGGHSASTLAAVAADLGLSPNLGPAELAPAELAPGELAPADFGRPEPDSESADAEQPPRAAAGRSANSHNATDRPPESHRDPQWQDPYAAGPDENGHTPRESERVSATGPVFGPWSGQSSEPARRARNGSRNGNGNGQAEASREPPRPESGPLGPLDRDWREPDSQDRDWPDSRRQDQGRPGRGRGDVSLPLRPERERLDPLPERERLDPLPERERPDVRPERERSDLRPERERHHPRTDRERPDPRPPHRAPPGPDRPGRVLPDGPHHETVQYGTIRPPVSRPDSDGLAELVEHTLTRCRAAEGRTAHGSYGSSGLTPAMHRLAAQLPTGGLAPGSEADSLKPADRFAAKLSRLIARQPARSPADLAASIGDAVRYAFAFEAADYTEGTWLVHRKLKTQGFELEARRNRWQSPEHKGIFTRWRDPAHGIAFEVQFHTMASWAVAKRTHDAYVRITDPDTPPAERAQLRAGQVAATASAKPPPGCMEIADFRSEPR
jgi:hypothetical protein